VRGGFLSRTGWRSSPNRCRPALPSVGRSAIARRERSGEGFSPAWGGDPPRTGVDRVRRRLDVRRLRVASSPGRISRPHKAATLPNPSPRPRIVRELWPTSPRRVESWIEVAGKRFPATWIHESTNCRLAWPGWCRHGLWTGALGESVEDAATQGRHAERRRRLNFRQPAVRSRLGFGVCLRWRAPRRPGSSPRVDAAVGIRIVSRDAGSLRCGAQAGRRWRTGHDAGHRGRASALRCTHLNTASVQHHAAAAVGGRLTPGGAGRTGPNRGRATDLWMSGRLHTEALVFFHRRPVN
jgi:hypothetical protein